MSSERLGVTRTAADSEDEKGSKSYQTSGGI